MENEFFIPKEISIYLLNELLGLSRMQELAKLETLQKYSTESGLLFNIQTKVKALPIKIPIGNVDVESKKDIDHFYAKEEDIKYFEFISFTLNQYFLSKGKATTCINWFKVDGESFHVVNDDNTDVGELYIDLSDVFVKKSDYDNFIKKAAFQMHEEKAPYQDINSEYYAPELDLAIQLHHAIQIEQYGNVYQKNIKNKVTKWLRENKKESEFSDAQLTRLSAIIGKNKNKN
jgi:uncharacterized protein YpiB (UPF0302 family)